MAKCKCKRLIFVFILVLSLSFDAFGLGDSDLSLARDESQNTSAFKDCQKIIGIPFLDTMTFDPAETENKIIECIRVGLKGMQNWPGDYDSLKKNKAIAIGYRKPSENPFIPFLYRHQNFLPSVEYWGGAWGCDSIEEAREKALMGCKKGSNQCVIFLENDCVIANDLVKDYIKGTRAYIEEQKKLLSQADKLLLLQSAIETVDRENRTRISAFYFTAGKPLMIGYPDYQQDYASICQDRVFYVLLRIPDRDLEKYKDQLDRLLKLGQYGCYQRSVNTVKDYTTPQEGRMMENMMRFVRYYSFRESPDEKELIMPKNLDDALSTEKIKEVWVEGSVRVTSKELPLIPSEYSRPLAIKTNESFYLGVEVRIPDNGSKCYVSKPFPNRVIDLSVCSNDLLCAKKVINTLSDYIQQELSSEPILAILTQDEEFAPGEFAMERQFKKSHTLGGPYYERSVYMIEIWVASSENPFYSLYMRQDFKGVGAKNVCIPGKSTLYAFLKVRHIFTSSVNKNDIYREPDEYQISKYKDAIQTAVNVAIDRTCRILQGELKDKLCTIVKNRR